MGYVHCHFVDRALSLRVKLHAGSRRCLTSVRPNPPSVFVGRKRAGSKRKKNLFTVRDLKVTTKKHRKNQMENLFIRWSPVVNNSRLDRKFPRAFFIESSADDLADGKSFANKHNRPLRRPGCTVNLSATVPSTSLHVHVREKFCRKRYQISRREIFSRYETNRARASVHSLRRRRDGRFIKRNKTIY